MTDGTSTLRPQPAQGARGKAFWAVKIVVALMFLLAGSVKLAGIQQMVDLFNIIGFGQRFRYVTGLIELTGAILILIPSRAAFGGLLLACTMIGAVITHLTVYRVESPLMALILLALSAAIAWAHRDQLPFLSNIKPRARNQETP